jgi:hypothetical protein
MRGNRRWSSSRARTGIVEPDRQTSFGGSFEELQHIARRFIVCTQSTGRVGKSTVAEGLINWLRYAAIDFGAVDADSQHQTLSRRYPQDSAILHATKTFDDFARMVKALPAFPVIIVDFPAQATDFLSSAAKHFRLLEFFEQSGVRPTLLVLARTIQQPIGDAADYLLVENPARFKSDEFKKTALCAWLVERSTPTLHIPTITALTMSAWEALERKFKRYPPLEEACQQKELHELSRYELGFLRDRFLVQFEDFAGQVLPDIDLVKKQGSSPHRIANRSARPVERSVPTHRMIDRKLPELSNGLPEKPELGILLSGCVRDAERKAVREAFYTFAQGDPGGFSVQFAVLLQAHARVLNRAPERLREALAVELEQMTDVIASNRLSLSTSASSITKDAADIHDQVVCFAEFQRELRELVSKMHKSEAVAREKFLAGISDKTNAIDDAAESIIFISGRWTLVAIIAVYLVGIASYPIFVGVVIWLEKVF